MKETRRESGGNQATESSKRPAVIEKSWSLAAKIVGVAFGTLIAPVIVALILKHVESGGPQPAPPPVAAGASASLGDAPGTSAAAAVRTASPASGSNSSDLPKPDALKSSLVGNWDLKSTDANWVGKLLLRSGPRGNVLGHIDWTGTGDSDGASGREYVSVNFDPATRILILTGKRLENATGLTLSTYEAKLSPDGNQLKNGKFSGGGVNGRWEGKRMNVMDDTR